MVSVCPPLSSPWCLEEHASVASPSHHVSSGPSPTPLSSASSPSHAPAPSPFLAHVAGAPSLDGLSLAPCRGGVPEGHVHAPEGIGLFTN